MSDLSNPENQLGIEMSNSDDQRAEEVETLKEANTASVVPLETKSKGGRRVKAYVAPVVAVPALVDLGDLIENKKNRLTEDAQRIRSHYATEDLVRVFIPRDKLEPKNVVHEFCINQFRFTIPKGRYVNVPESVAALIAEAYEQSNAVMDEHPLNLQNNLAAKQEFER